MFKIGDLVTRESYKHDVIFVITDIDENNIHYLKGLNIRLHADSEEGDLKLYNKNVDDSKEETEFLDRIKSITNIEDRDEYFYLPGKILHIDADSDYLNKCLDYYKNIKIMAVGKIEKEDIVPNKIQDWIYEYSPNIVVITGHDAYYRKGRKSESESYKNSFYFIESIKAVRRIEMSQDKLIIIAGACQSNYEELIKAGANFASSPKRINIHALDPAIVASSMALSDSSKEIDLKKILENTKYGSSGIGGIMTKGTMHIGYPR